MKKWLSLLREKDLQSDPLNLLSDPLKLLLSQSNLKPGCRRARVLIRFRVSGFRFNCEKRIVRKEAK